MPTSLTTRTSNSPTSERLAWDRTEAIGRLRRDIWRYVTQASTTDDDHPAVGGRPPADAARRGALPRAAAVHPERASRPPPRADAVAHPPADDHDEPTKSRSAPSESAARSAGARPSRSAPRRASRTSSSPRPRGARSTRPRTRSWPSRCARSRNSVVAPAGTRRRRQGRRSSLRARVAEATRWRQARALVDVPARPPVAHDARARAREPQSPALSGRPRRRRALPALHRTARPLRDPRGDRAPRAHREPRQRAPRAPMRLRHHPRPTADSAGRRRPPACSSHRTSSKLTKRTAGLICTTSGAPAALSGGSLYREIQKAHSFASTGGLIPDLVLRVHSADATRWVLIEVKGGPKRGVADNARAAALDLLAYRRAYAPVLDDTGRPVRAGLRLGTRPRAHDRRRSNSVYARHARRRAHRDPRGKRRRSLRPA